METCSVHSVMSHGPRSLAQNSLHSVLWPWVLGRTFSTPRTINPKARSANSFTYFIEVCNQHRNEATIIPEGLQRGWPQEIDFKALPRRLSVFNSELDAIVKDPSSSSFFRNISNPPPASSMEGRRLIFQRSQPGYYGECGYVRIFGILSRLYPNLASDLCGGGLDCSLDPIAFISRVLVPESARLLIKDDLNVSDKDALDILVESRLFGTALHPDSDSNYDN